MTKKILSGIFIALLLIVVGFFVISLMPIKGGIKIKIVKSGSMEPSIKTGGIIAIKPRDSYGVGDIITFGMDTKESIPTTHRIIALREEGGVTYFSTKGDANEEVDPDEISSDSVIGKVLFTIPYAGFILDFAKQPVGFISLIAVPAGLVIMYEIIAIFGEVKNFKNRNEQV